MKLRILSDLHFEFHKDAGKGMVRELVAEPGEVLVLAGDIAVGHALPAALGLFCAKFDHVVYVAGNHEYYRHDPIEVTEILQQCTQRFANFHWLDSSAVTIAGQRFVGATLWFSEHAGEHPARHFLSDFAAIEDFEPWVYRQHERAVAYLGSQVRPTDVVVTHHLPSQVCVHPKWETSPLNAFFVHDLEWLIRDRQPKLWIHGHTHEPVDVQLGATRIVANPFGYKGVEEPPGFSLDFAVVV